MIEWVQLRDFKSFEDQTVRLAPFTVLVGANAAGKSNFLDGLRFVQGLGLGVSLQEVLMGRYSGGQQVWRGLRGGTQEVARHGTDSFAVAVGWRLDEQELVHCIRCGIGETPSVLEERLAAVDHGDYLFDTEAASLGNNAGPSDGGAINAALKRTGSGRSLSSTYRSDRSLVVQLTALPSLHEAVLPSAKALTEQWAKIRALDMRPDLMREYVSKHAELGERGENLSAATWQLVQDAETRTDMLDWISALCGQEFEDLGFVETSLGDVMMTVTEHDGTVTSARSLSDGTLRFLGQIVALFTAPAGSVLLFEELENGLHPGRVQLLVGLIDAVTKTRGIQVITTSHSGRLLEALPTVNALEDAVLFVRPRDQTTTIARRFGDIEGFGEAVKRRGVEELLATGWLERAVWMS